MQRKLNQPADSRGRLAGADAKAPANPSHPALTAGGRVPGLTSQSAQAILSTIADRLHSEDLSCVC